MTQETFKNWARGEQETYNYRMLHSCLADLASQNYQNLYFTTASVTQVVNEEEIKMAARTRVDGLLFFVTLADMSKKEKEKIVDKFSRLAKNVDDIDKYNCLIAEIN